jgi:hypothetical protein
MTRDEILRMAEQAGIKGPAPARQGFKMYASPDRLRRFAALVAAHERKACIEIIETYRIPVGNSPSGELACEWTYRALHEIRDDIRARGEQ